jgi:hypothetical protein
MHPASDGIPATPERFDHAMNRCGRLQLVLFGALWLAAAPPGSAQFRRENDPHNQPYDRNDVQPTIADPQAALTRRLRSAEDFGDAEKIAQKLLSDPERLRKFLKDEELKDLINRINRDQAKQVNRIAKDLANSPELRKKLNESLHSNDFKDVDTKKLHDVIAPRRPDARTETTASLVTIDPTSNSGQDTGSTNPSGTTASAGSTPERSKTKPDSEKRSWLDQQILKQGVKLAEYLDTLGDGDDGDAVRSLLRAFAGSRDGDSSSGGPIARMFRRAGEAGELIDFDKLMSGDWAGALDKVKLPDMPSFRLPRWGSSSPARPSSFSGGPASFGPVDSIATAVMWTLVIGVLLVLAFKGRGWISHSNARTGGSWRLGPWPVRPNQVQTRGDLVRAFEYLAFLLIGPAARPRNHIDLADGLAGQDTDQRRAAADRLARLYERARYAPEIESLPDAELHAARHDLAFLAGVAAA